MLELFPTEFLPPYIALCVLTNLRSVITPEGPPSPTIKNLYITIHTLRSVKRIAS